MSTEAICQALMKGCAPEVKTLVQQALDAARAELGELTVQLKESRHGQLEVEARLGVAVARAEEAAHRPEHREQYDLVVARAVAPLVVLAEYCLPLCLVGGRMIAQKGEGVAQEVSDAARAIGLLGGSTACVKSVALPEVWRDISVDGVEGFVNPIRSVYLYLPCAFLAMTPLAAVSGSDSLGDPRWVMLATFVAACVVIARRPEPPWARAAFLAALVAISLIRMTWIFLAFPVLLLGARERTWRAVILAGLGTLALMAVVIGLALGFVQQRAGKHAAEQQRQQKHRQRHARRQRIKAAPVQAERPVI